MSEQRSLYVNIKIGKERLEQFFQSKPTKAIVDENWLAWWNSREMYSPQPLTEIYTYPSATNRIIGNGYFEIPELVAGEDLSQDGIWIFSVLMLSENFEEILPTLSWLKSIAAYMAPEDEGTAIIYDHFWGDKDVMAHLEFKDQQGVLKLTKHCSELDPALLEKADATLTAAYEKFSANYND